MNEYLRGIFRGVIVIIMGLGIGLIGVAIIFIFSLLGGCSSVPSKPTVTTVTVTEYRPLDPVLTDALAIPANVETVGEHLEREKTLESTLILANCHRQLAARLSDGETVSAKLCEQ